MGINNRDALRVILDIETCPLPDAPTYLDFSEITAPSTYKDPEKIKQYCEDKKAKQIAEAALDLDLCQIVAIGWLVEDSQLDPVVCTLESMSEAEMIALFWRELDNRVTVGYNQVGFDLPILHRRSLYLGVPAPALNLDKYRTPHLDLQQRLSWFGTKPYRSLQWYCKRFGIDVGDDPITGKDITQLVIDGKWAAIAHHCQSDVLHTKALAERLCYLKQQPVMTEALF